MAKKHHAKDEIDNGSAKKDEATIESNHDKSQKVPQRDKLKNSLSIYNRTDLTEKQKEILELILDKKTNIVFINGPAGSSKAQPLDAKILGKDGWLLMGNIKVGDLVYSIDGNLTKVLGVYPQGQKEIYKVTFSDGSFTECCMDHLWFTQTDADKNWHTRVSGAPRGTKKKSPREGGVKTLKEIEKTLFVRGSRPNHYIPMVKPINFPEKKHIIHPYILGILLGDGCLKTNVSFTSSDPEIAQNVSNLLPKNLTVSVEKTESLTKNYNIVRLDGKAEVYCPNPFKEELKRLNLWGKYSYEKFVPEEYLFDSISARTELLRGLMDTDGTTSGSHASYCSTSKKLSSDVQFLVNSFGGVSTIQERENFYTYKDQKLKGRNSFTATVSLGEEIVPFKLLRKKNIYQFKTKYLPSRSIVKIELVGLKEAQCIKVENQSRLYVTDRFIVTHNTFLAVYAALIALNNKTQSDILYLRSAIESSSRSLGALPGNIDEKMDPYLMPLYDKLEELLAKNEVDLLMKEKRITGNVVNFIRGSSWNAKFIIVDEAQNLTPGELKTIVTRLGKYSKLIILGDSGQSDLKEKSGFLPFFDMFSGEESQHYGIFCRSFTKQDIVRSKILGYILDKIEGTYTPPVQ